MNYIERSVDKPSFMKIYLNAIDLLDYSLCGIVQLEIIVYTNLKLSFMISPELYIITSRDLGQQLVKSYD